MTSLLPAYGASRSPGATKKPAGGATVLFDEDWTGVAKGALPKGVSLVSGQAHIVAAQGKLFLQVDDSASLDLELAGALPDAYTIEIEMQVPASTGYSVELRPEPAPSPAGYASPARRSAHPVALCGAIASGVYGASSGTSPQKRYPNTDATTLRTCKVEVEAGGVKVFFAGQLAADAVGADLGPGTLLRLHVPASSAAPALIGAIHIAAAPGSVVTPAKAQTPFPTVPVSYFEVDGSSGGVASVFMAEGGEAIVQTLEKALPQGGKQVQLGPVRYADIVAHVTPGELTGLMQNWLAGPLGPLHGRMVGFGYDKKPRYQRAFDQAALTEAAFPALDAVGGQRGYLRLRFVPGSTRLEAPAPLAALPQKTGGKGAAPGWLTRNFSVSIPGVDASRVLRIEPFAVTRNGGTRLSLTLGAKGAETWADWHESFVANGNAGDKRTLKIVLFGANVQDELLVLQGSGVSLLALRPEPTEAAAKAIARYAAELYVEQWRVLP